MVKVITEFEQISGIFLDDADIERLLEDLANRGVNNDDISVLMSETTGNRYFTMKGETKLPEGATLGGLSGGILGTIIGGLTMVGTVLIPGVGLLAAGPLVGAIAGGSIGITAGGLIGGLVGSGIPEHEAKFYEDALKEDGTVLVVAHVLKENVREIKALFERYGAEQLKIHR